MRLFQCIAWHKIPLQNLTLNEWSWTLCRVPQNVREEWETHIQEIVAGKLVEPSVSKINKAKWARCASCRQPGVVAHHTREPSQNNLLNHRAASPCSPSFLCRLKQIDHLNLETFGHEISDLLSDLLKSFFLLYPFDHGENIQHWWFKTKAALDIHHLQDHIIINLFKFKPCQKTLRRKWQEHWHLMASHSIPASVGKFPAGLNLTGIGPPMRWRVFHHQPGKKHTRHNVIRNGPCLNCNHHLRISMLAVVSLSFTGCQMCQYVNHWLSIIYIITYII